MYPDFLEENQQMVNQVNHVISQNVLQGQNTRNISKPQRGRSDQSGIFKHSKVFNDKENNENALRVNTNKLLDENKYNRPPLGARDLNVSGAGSPLQNRRGTDSRKQGDNYGDKSSRGENLPKQYGY